MKTATRDVMLAFAELMVRLPDDSKLPQMLLDLLNERDAFDASHQRLKEALDMARALLVDLEGYEPDGPSVSVIDDAIEHAKDLS